MELWESQSVSENLQKAIEVTARLVNDNITNPEAGISNVTEWCKKDLCWLRLQKKHLELERILPAGFKSELISKSEIVEEKKSARKTQKIDNGIEAQKKVLEIAGPKWQSLLQRAQEKGLLTAKETGILQIAAQIPGKIPSEKKSMVLVGLLEKAEQEGIVVNE